MTLVLGGTGVVRDSCLTICTALGGHKPSTCQESGDYENEPDFPYQTEPRSEDCYLLFVQSQINF